MKTYHRVWRWNVVSTGLACAMCFAAAGCGDPVVNSGVAHPGNPRSGDGLARPATETGDGNTPAVNAPSADAAQASDAVTAPNTAGADPAAQSDPARPRTFEVEGPSGALRVTFDDLDLLKLIQMDNVTPDCVEKMPDWLKGLSGKQVRVRGYMKPSTQLEKIPQFLFVRSTDLCCFGPKGKVYHMIAVSLKPGTTTSYIELKPFDVVGMFRIEKIQLDDGTIFLLYHIEDGTIIRS
jgi:hypothetical protein